MVQPLTKSTASRLLTSFGAGLAVAVTIPLAFLAVVAFGPPGIAGPNARMWVGFAPWWVVLGLVATLVSALLVGRRKGAGWKVLLGVASLALVAHTVVMVQLLSAGWEQGERVNPWATPPGSAETEPPDLTAVYDSYGGRDLSVLVWTPPPSTEASRVMVYVHGGGWVSGHPSGRAPQLRWFADHGWLVIAPEYSLSGPDRHLWDTAPSQVGCALVWAAQNAPGLGGDPSRMALVGDSAGGNLAVNAAYEAASGNAGSSCGGDVPRVRAVVGLYAVLDPVGFHDDGWAPMAQDLTEDYLGGTPQQFPDRYAEVASATHLSPDAPPTLLFVPGSDELVPPDGAREFAAQGTAAGVEVGLVDMAHLGHAFDAAWLPDELYRRVTLHWLTDRVG